MPERRDAADGVGMLATVVAILMLAVVLALELGALFDVLRAR